MSLNEMLETHPHAPRVDQELLRRCIDECFRCAATCTSCADACLGEDDVQELIRCIRLNLDCADVCEAAGKLLTRQTATEPRIVRSMVESCATTCRVCAAECQRHAEQHEHCRVCAAACRRCEEACEDVLATIA